MLAVDAAKRPHFDDDHLAAQVRQAQRRVHIQPGGVREFGSQAQVR
jgi:hypothetical protein